MPDPYLLPADYRGFKLSPSIRGDRICALLESELFYIQADELGELKEAIDRYWNRSPVVQQALDMD